MTRKEAYKILELLPQLLLADVVTLELLVKNGEFKEARQLAKKMRKVNLFGS